MKRAVKNQYTAVAVIPQRKDLTERQRLFVDSVARGDTYKEASSKAGYLSGKDAYRTARIPEVAYAIQKQREDLFQVELAPLAFNQMLRLLSSPETPAAVCFQVCKWVLENAGHGLEAKKALGPISDETKPLHMMDINELNSLLHKTKAALEA